MGRVENCLCCSKWELSHIMTKNDSNEVGQLRHLNSNSTSFSLVGGYATDRTQSCEGGEGHCRHMRVKGETAKVDEMRGKLWTEELLVPLPKVKESILHQSWLNLTRQEIVKHNNAYCIKLWNRVYNEVSIVNKILVNEPTKLKVYSL